MANITPDPELANKVLVRRLGNLELEIITLETQLEAADKVINEQAGVLNQQTTVIANQKEEIEKLQNQVMDQQEPPAE
jgi:uncharacterized coiled-coil protein SlyX